MLPHKALGAESGGPPPTPRVVTGTPGGRFGLALTNVAKLIGVLGGVHEAVGPARYAAVMFWLALFVGAQGVEDMFTKLIRQLTETGK